MLPLPNTSASSQPQASVVAARPLSQTPVLSHTHVAAKDHPSTLVLTLARQVSDHAAPKPPHVQPAPLTHTAQGPHLSAHATTSSLNTPLTYTPLNQISQPSHKPSSHAVKPLTSSPIPESHASSLVAKPSTPEDHYPMHKASYAHAAMGLASFHTVVVDHTQVCPGAHELKPVGTHDGKPSIRFKKADKQWYLDLMKYVLVGKFSHGRPTIAIIKEFFIALKLKGAYNISLRY
ncbi:hypothetical protein LIER_35176 [Lithospermum erythrorhizon]|uniref:Uncharacterized protein n=1 Tax=Lithospermum erythrorhizon TaxID=34254 RepID=A0AAV3NLD8_LITER